jgi:hypothetical protein
MLSTLKVRVIANACITRYDRGEGTMTEIVDSYNLSAEDANLVKAEIIAKRPDIEIE